MKIILNFLMFVIACVLLLISGWGWHLLFKGPPADLSRERTPSFIEWVVIFLWLGILPIAGVALLLSSLNLLP